MGCSQHGFGDFFFAGPSHVQPQDFEIQMSSDFCLGDIQNGNSRNSERPELLVLRNKHVENLFVIPNLGEAWMPMGWRRQ